MAKRSSPRLATRTGSPNACPKSISPSDTFSAPQPLSKSGPSSSLDASAIEISPPSNKESHATDLSALPRLLLLIPPVRKQLARFFHTYAPDLQHLFVVALIPPAIVAVLAMLPHCFRIEGTSLLRITHRLLFRWHCAICQPRAW